MDLERRLAVHQLGFRSYPLSFCVLHATDSPWAMYEGYITCHSGDETVLMAHVHHRIRYIDFRI